MSGASLRLWMASLALASVLLFAFAGLRPKTAGAEHPRRGGAAELVNSLNPVLHATRGDVEGVRLVAPCLLQLSPSHGSAVQVDLRALEVRRGSRDEEGLLELYVQPPGLLFLATDSWPAWAAAQSDFSQLRARCARSAAAR